MNHITLHFLLSIAVLGVVKAWVWQRQFPPNENWRCQGCPGNETLTKAIFGMIRHALYAESREVYLNMDHSWIDTLLGPKASVSVTGIPRDQLGAFVAPDYHSAEHERDEEFHVIFSLPAAPSQQDLKPLTFTEGEIIDKFLTRNPCWIPIHDPPVAAIREPLESFWKSNQIFEHSAILVRLPAFWFHSTCQLFKLVTKKQFPEHCPSASNLDNVKAYWLGNIGWANCVHPVQEHLRDALYAGHLFINPRAYQSGDPNLEATINGKSFSLGGTWRWASKEECDPETYAFNPWHCHFMSISGCNTPELRDAVPFQDNWRYSQEEREKWPKQEFFLELEKIKATREMYGDAPRLGNEWIDSRLLAFVLRPNIVMRHRLRAKLATALVIVKPGSEMSFTQNASKDGNMLHHSHLSAHHAREIRLGLHVRDGDSRNDMRGSAKIDRSFEFHMKCAEYLTTQLGVQNFYLATDNVTLYKLAPIMYPQYGWFAQQRILKPYPGQSFLGYFNEISVHQDVANILVDLILMSRSAGFVGSHDGGFYVLFTQYLCLRNKKGYCPPTYSIQDCSGVP